MARQVPISTQTTRVASAPVSPEFQSIANIGGALGDAAKVTANIAGDQGRQKTQLDLAANKALSENQFDEYSLKFESDWNTTRADYAKNYNEQEVDANFDNQRNLHIDAIESDTTLTDDAKSTLTKYTESNLNAARKSFMDRKATAKANAALDSLNRIVGLSVESGDINKINEVLDRNVANGVISADAAGVVKEEATTQISINQYSDVIEQLSTADASFTIPGTDGETKTAIDLLDDTAGEIKSNATFTDKQKNGLLDDIRLAKSSSYSEQAIYIIGLKPNLQNRKLTQSQVDRIADPKVQAEWQANLDIMNDNITEADAVTKAKDAATTKAGLAKTEEIESKARAAEAELILTGTTIKNYTKFSPSKEQIGSMKKNGKIKNVYAMTLSEHLQKMKYAMAQFNSTSVITDISDPKIKYTGGDARRYIEHEISAVADKEQRSLLEDNFQSVLANTDNNGTLFDVDEKATGAGRLFGRAGKSLYPKDLQPLIRLYEDNTRLLLKDLELDATGPNADLEMIRAWNNGLDFVTYSYNIDKKEYAKNQEQILKGAMSEFTFIANRKKVQKAIQEKLNESSAAGTSSPSAAGTSSPSAAPILVNTQAEYDALPSGTRFINSKGETGVKK